MIVFANGALTVADAPMAGIAPYLLSFATKSTAGQVLDPDEVRDLRDSLSDWLERCGR